jgi:hypothetical protein
MKDVIAVTSQCSRIAASVLGKSKSIPFATSGFAEHAAPV